MANYSAVARTNHIKVRDTESFLSWVETLPGVCAEKDTGTDDTFVLLTDGDNRGWPDTSVDEHTGEERRIDYPGELSKHLADGEVAVLVEAGSEKLRYVVGNAIAINCHGDVLTVSMEDIYQKVIEAGWAEKVSRATY